MVEELLDGRYRLESRIGQGAMGDVWLARDTQLGRRVAIKRLRTVLVDENTLVQRLRREARLASQLQHQNVVSVFDLRASADGVYVVMEYVDGESLAARIKRGRLSPAEAAGIIGQVAAGLAAVHQFGVLHRDVKPANILLANDGVAKLADFGIARAPDDTLLTQSGQLLGTPSFLPPEAFLGVPPTAKTDVWSLGATFYAAVEGQAPFTPTGDVHIAALAFKVTTEPAPRSDNAGPWADLIAQMLERDPEQRPTAGEVAGLLTGSAVSPSRRRSWHRPALAGAAAIAVVGGAAAAVLIARDAPASSASHSGAHSSAPRTPSATPAASRPPSAFASQVGRFAVGAAPAQLLVSSDGSRAYVLDEGDGDQNSPGAASLEVIDLGTQRALRTVHLLPQAADIVMAPDGRHVYVAEQTAQTYQPGYVAAVDTSTFRVVRTRVDAAPGALAISPDGTLLAVGNINTASITFIHTATMTVAHTINLHESTPSGLAFSDDGHTLYAVHDGTADTLTAFDARTYGSLWSIPMPAPQALAIDGRYLYIVRLNQTVVPVLTVIDATTHAVVGETTLIPNHSAYYAIIGGMQLTASGRYAYISASANPDGSTVPSQLLVVDLTNPSAPKVRFATPSTYAASSFALSHDGARLYMIDSADNQVLVDK